MPLGIARRSCRDVQGFLGPQVLGERLLILLDGDSPIVTEFAGPLRKAPHGLVACDARVPCKHIGIATVRDLMLPAGEKSSWCSSATTRFGSIRRVWTIQL